MIDATWYGNTEGNGITISGSALHSLHSRVSDLSYLQVQILSYNLSYILSILLKESSTTEFTKFTILKKQQFLVFI